MIQNESNRIEIHIAISQSSISLFDAKPRTHLDIQTWLIAVTPNHAYILNLITISIYNYLYLVIVRLDKPFGHKYEGMLINTHFFAFAFNAVHNTEWRSQISEPC